uniref:Nucleotidyltransferase domain-containing protein n=1 Tax=Candidatus Kentrum sp. SD TaxID=2126332 RepID=A0A450YA19_9GAMM|nr:MAG: Nucleotidyltransferase domain-containing protein [Candidatus Kentron sp. SD]VFK43523.1 MAG: Nucleotidyltransferase domain-containing protein [Candidatus Kentron sp. SD]VFK79582.1 MAG: Nucleotidyltransferase domain-containing protein [Candidatus Kentron sp. SD]
MRLTTHEISAIKSAINRRDPKAEIYLFGSRTDDGKRGGDIDLLVMSKRIDAGGKTAIIMELHDRLGEQRIDMIVAADTTRPFARIALGQGVRL